MNLKYYLRGLGIGIVITALIMGIASGGRKETLSNEEIKERARELGMVEESTILADVEKATPSTTPLPSAAKEPEGTPAPTKEPAPSATEEPVPTPSKEPVSTAAPTSAPTATPTPVQMPEPSPQMEQGETDLTTSTVTVQINSGDGSLTVSRKLEEAGLVPSAAEFDWYLCQNGYDKRLNVGTFEIPAGADEEQIAKILGGR